MEQQAFTSSAVNLGQLPCTSYLYDEITLCSATSGKIDQPSYRCASDTFPRNCAVVGQYNSSGMAKETIGSTANLREKSCSHYTIRIQRASVEVYPFS